MLVLTAHTTTPTAVTMISYDQQASLVIVKQLSSDGDHPAEMERIPLASFLRQIGITVPKMELVPPQTDPMPFAA